MDVIGTVPEVINCHQCGGVIDLTGQQAFTHVDCPQCGAISVVPMQFGNFLLLNALGIGGMGTVYKAVDLSLNRHLALKILRPKLAAKPEFIESFSREARAAAAVNHPNIAQVYSFGEHENQYYLAMELLERGSLDDRMSTLGKLPEKDVLEIAYQVASGLRAAAQRGLLHRDIKPGNILFNDDGAPKIVDFGLARAQSALEAKTAGTEPIWGTPYYIAPEKLRGQPEDVRSDIYSLGATLYHALAGRPPFDAATASEVVTKHATQPIFSLKTYAPNVHDRTAQLIGRTLSKSPTERYENYDEMIHDIHEAQELLKVEQGKKVMVSASGEKVPIASIIITAVAVFVAIVAGIAVWYNSFRSPLAPPPPAPPVSIKPATTNTTVAVVGPGTENETDTVNFQEEAAWVKSWNNAMLQLTQGNYQKAFESYRQAMFLASDKRDRVKRWILYFEGMTLMAADRPVESQTSFIRARNPSASRTVPATVTINNFIDPLSYVMSGDMDVSKLEDVTPRLPAWAKALALVSAAFKHLDAGNLDKAIRAFRQYQAMKKGGEQDWVYNLQPLTERLTSDCERVRTALADISHLESKKNYREAMDNLQKTQERTSQKILRPILKQAERRVQAELDEQQKANEHTKQEDERRRQEEEAKARAQAEAETKALQAIEPEILPLFQVYDFKAAMDKYDAYRAKLATPAGQEAIQRRIDNMKMLVEFKEQLAADLLRRPFTGAMRTLAGTQPVGNLVRASDTKLVFATQFGEVTNNWKDFAPAELVKVAEFELQSAAVTEKADAQAGRYLRLAIFCKQYALDKAAAYGQQAVKLNASLEKQVRDLIGPPK